MPDEPEDSGPVIEVIMVIADLGIDENGKTCHGIGLTKETKQNPKYHNVVPQYLWDSLRLVLLQRFLREKAALLNKDHIDIPVLGSIIQDLSSRLQDERLFDDVADVKLIIIDVCLNCETNAGIIYNAVALGEAMEAAGNYEDAAKVYIEISEAKIFPRISRICPEIRSRNFAGLAFKRAQDDVRAEEQYVAALRAAGPNWSFRDAEIENLLDNTLIFYEVAHMAVMSGQRIDNEHKQIQQACLLLVGLLSIAGWVGNGGCRLMDAQNPQGYKVLQGNLKREYKTPRKAMRALQNAFSAPNIEEYHKRLFACSKYASIITIADNETKSSIEETFAKEPAKSKSGAQAEFKKCQLDYSNTLASSSLCNGCNERKSPEQMKACPCQTVSYCSVECQKVHWPIHKRVCPYRKRNKK